MEVLHLTPTERGELQSYLRKRNLPASVAQRMRIVLLLDEGSLLPGHRREARSRSLPRSRAGNSGMRRMECSVWPRSIPASRRRSSRRSCAPRCWSGPGKRRPMGPRIGRLRKMAAVMKVSKNLIARIWKEADLKPHRLERYMASNDPQFEQKAAAIIGLYLESAAKCRRVLCGRKERHSSAWTGWTAACRLSPGRRREARLRVLPARDALAVRGAESANRRGHRPDRCAPHQPGVCCLPGRSRRHQPAGRRDPRHPGQLRHAQNRSGEALPSTASPT